jgi:hypothetical protein
MKRAICGKRKHKLTKENSLKIRKEEIESKHASIQ